MTVFFLFCCTFRLAFKNFNDKKKEKKILTTNGQRITSARPRGIFLAFESFFFFLHSLVHTLMFYVYIYIIYAVIQSLYNMRFAYYYCNGVSINKIIIRYTDFD